MTLLFIGPLGFLLATLLLILIILVIARVILKLGWHLIIIGALILFGLWLVGLMMRFPPGRGL